MRRIRILAPALAIAAVALAAIVGAASANGGPSEGDSYATPGVLEASGDGIAAAAGKLSLHLCADEGILLTKGNTEVEGSFTDEVSWLGLHVYFGFSGCADVTGSSYYGHSTGTNGGRTRAAALVVGVGLDLRAEGTGIAFLKGEGTWAKDNGDSGEWSEEGTILRIGNKKASCEVTAHHNKPKCKTPTAEPTAEPTDEPDPEPTATPTEDEEP